MHSAWVWVVQRCFSILLWKKLLENKRLEGVKLTQTRRWDRLLVNELSFKISFTLIKFVNSVVRASNFIGFELNNTFDVVDGAPNHFSISDYIPASDIRILLKYTYNKGYDFLRSDFCNKDLPLNVKVPLSLQSRFYWNRLILVEIEWIVSFRNISCSIIRLSL